MRLGELEITFFKKFCRAANLTTLLQDHKVPESLKPYTERIKVLIEPKPPVAKKQSNSKLEQLDNKILSLLIETLNRQKSKSCVWVPPDLWCSYSKDRMVGHSPCPARAILHTHVEKNDVTFSSLRANMKNSVIIFNLQSTGSESFGRITKIFTHRRSPRPDENLMDTWLHVQIFSPVPRQFYNPFEHIKEPDVQAHLRLWYTTTEEVIRLDDVIAHCAWLMYQPGEIKGDIKVPTIALVSMKR